MTTTQYWVLVAVLLVQTGGLLALLARGHRDLRRTLSRDRP